MPLAWRSPLTEYSPAGVPNRRGQGENASGGAERDGRSGGRYALSGRVASISQIRRTSANQESGRSAYVPSYVTSRGGDEDYPASSHRRRLDQNQQSR